MTDDKQSTWEAWAVKKYGSIEKARQIRSEAGKNAKGISKRTVWGDNPEIAREAARSKRKG